MDAIQLAGPGLWALRVLALLIWASAGFVTVDSLRRRHTDYAGVFEGRWFYAAPQALFFVVFIVWQVPAIRTAAPWIDYVIIAIPVALAEQMAYLLRVVYPTAKRLEKRLDAECDLLRDSEEESAAVAAPHPEPKSDADAPRTPEDDSFFDPDNPDD